MPEEKPETMGKLAPEEIKELNTWDIVLLEEKLDPEVWFVGDVVSLSTSGMWDLTRYDVYNIQKVPIASLSAHKRWVIDKWYGTE